MSKPVAETKRKAAVLLAGAGQLGSRYLQGLVSAQRVSSAFVYDPSEGSLALAEERLQQVEGSDRLKVTFSSSLEDAPQCVGIAIVATPANVRLSVVAEILSRTHVRYWVLEKVLAQSITQIEEIVRLTTGADGAWVNTARRVMPWYQEILEAVSGNGPFVVEKRGFNWGLTCNGIHIIDLLQWWSGSPPLSVDASGIREWFPSKRNGFYEAHGTIRAEFADGSRVTLHDSKSYENDAAIRVQTKNDEWIINEANGTAVSNSGISSEGKIVYQSALTGRVVDMILKTGTCGLPTLGESADLHRPYVAAIARSWHDIKPNNTRNDLEAPIT